MSRDHSQNHYGPNASFDGYDSDLASAGILIESLRQQLALSNKCLKRVQEACLFSEDDGSIGVTQDPHIHTQLFDDICKALVATEPKP